MMSILSYNARQNGHELAPLPIYASNALCVCRVSKPALQRALSSFVLAPLADLGLVTALDGVDGSS